MAVLEVMVGVDFGNLEPSGLLELFFLGILTNSAKLDSLQKYFYFNKGFLDEKCLNMVFSLVLFSIWSVKDYLQAFDWF